VNDDWTSGYNASKTCLHVPVTIAEVIFPRVSTMARRRVLRFSLLAGVTVVVVLLAMWLLSPPTMISPENYDKIRKGMCHDEVVALLGAPNQIRNEPLLYRWFKPGTDRPEWTYGDRHRPDPDARKVRSVVWFCPASWFRPEFVIIIDFDNDDRVCGSEYLIAHDPKK